MDQQGPFLLVSGVLIALLVVTFGLLLSGSNDQTVAIREAAELHHQRAATGLSITSSDAKVITVGSGKCATAYVAVDTTVENSGRVAVSDFPNVDVVLDYLKNPSGKGIERLQYVSASPSAGEWTKSSMSPNTLDANIWDPKDVLTIRARPSVQPQGGSTGTVAVAAPLGAADSDYVAFDYAERISNDCRYLHNNPTPPTGDTNLQAVLPMNTTTPTAITLYNYDLLNLDDLTVDANPGRTVKKGGSGPSETIAALYQAWRSGQLSESLTLSGTVAVDLWSAMGGFQLNKDGIINVFLRDYDGSGYTEIKSATLYDVDWQGGSGSFVRKVVWFTGLSYTVPAGHELEAKMTVGAITAAEMWLAYDTTAYQSLVNLTYVEPTFTTLMYLHNNPTPPVGNTNAQGVLPANSTAPTAGTLYNYDTNQNADPGRTLDKTTLGLSETLPRRRQVWRSGALGSNLSLVGDVKIDLWAASANFAQGLTGIVTVYLRDKSGGNYTEIGHATVFSANWQDGSGTWVTRSILFSGLNYTINAGRELEVFMVVENASSGSMWFAYDTALYPAVVKIP